MERKHRQIINEKKALNQSNKSSPSPNLIIMRLRVRRFKIEWSFA